MLATTFRETFLSPIIPKFD